MRNLKTIGQAIFFYGESVVLRSDLYLAGFAIQHGLICASMTKFKLKCLCSASQGEQLVPKANSKDRLFSEQIFNCLDSVAQRFGIAGTIAQEYPVRFACQNCVGCRGSGQNRDLVAALSQMTWDVPFHTIVEANNMRLGCGRFAFGSVDGQCMQRLAPFFGTVWHDLLDQVSSHQPRTGLGFRDERCVIGIQRRNNSFQGTRVANATNERSGVDS